MIRGCRGNIDFRVFGFMEPFFFLRAWGLEIWFLVIHVLVFEGLPVKGRQPLQNHTWLYPYSLHCRNSRPM